MINENSANQKISSIMIQNVYTVSNTASLKEVVQTMIRCTASGLPVIDDTNQVVGFISDGDIMKYIAKQDPRVIDMVGYITFWRDTISLEEKMQKLMNLNVMELATKKVISVEATCNIDEVAKVVSEKKIKKVPVVDHGKLIGIVSRSDILRYSFSTYVKDIL